MIATPKPGSDLWRVLALVVANDGQLDAGAIAATLRPYKAVEPAPPLVWSPVGASAAYSAWRASIQGRHQARATHEREATEWASTCLQRLTSIRLLVPARSRAPELSAWFLDMSKEHGYGEALYRALNAGESDCLDDMAETDDDAEDFADALAMVEQVRNGPASTGVLLGDGSGEVRRCYTRLIEAGVVVPPSYRWATEAGRELIAKGGSQNTPLRLSSRLRYAAAENPDVVNDSEVKGA